MIIYLSLLAIFFSSMVYGVIGFGDALILIPLIRPLIGLENAIILVNLWGILTALLNYIKYRKLLDKGYFIRFLSLGKPSVKGKISIIFKSSDVNLRSVWLSYGPE